MAVIDALTAKPRNWLKKTGDTMISGFLTLFQDPTDPLHAVTKQYVDGLVGGGTSDVQDFIDLRTTRIGGMTAGNIAGSGTQTVVVYGLTTVQDGTAQAPVSADSSVGQGWNDGEGTFGGWSTATGTNAIGGIRTVDGFCRGRHGPALALVMRNGVNQAISIDNCRIWIGFFSTLPVSTDDPVGHVAGFRWSTAAGGAGDTVIRVLTKDGVTLRNTPSSTAFSVGRVTKLAIDWRTMGTIKYYIDDVLVDTVTSGLPDDNTDLFMVVRIVNGNGGGNSTIRLSSLMAISN